LLRERRVRECASVCIPKEENSTPGRNNITNREQVEKIFKFSAYLAWDNTNLFSNYGNENQFYSFY